MLMTDILKGDQQFDMIIVYNKSPRYMAMVNNLVRRRLGVENSDIIRVSSMSEIIRHADLLRTKPLYSPYWLVLVEEAKYNMSKELVTLINTVSNFKLVIGVKNYGDFLKFRYDRSLKQVKKDIMYGSMLAKEEFQLVYKATIKSKYAVPLSSKLYEFVEKGYLREPESVFKLLSLLKEGVSFGDRREIISAIGLGNLTVEQEVLSLLSSRVSTERGLKQFMKRHGRMMLELSARYSTSSLKSAILRSLKALILIKSLIAKGDIIVGLPVNVDFKPYKNSSLNIYARRVEQIDEISLKKMVYMLGILESTGRWSDNLDLFNFLYTYTRHMFTKETMERLQNASKGNIFK